MKYLGVTLLSPLSFQVSSNNGLDGVLTMISTNSLFFNESEISFKFEWRSSSELPPDVNVQVGPESWSVTDIGLVTLTA